MGPAGGRLQPRAASGTRRRGSSGGSCYATVYIRRSAYADGHAHRDVLGGRGAKSKGVGTFVAAQ